MAIEALLQNYCRRGLKLWEDHMEQFVASDGNYFERVTCQYNEVISKPLF